MLQSQLFTKTRKEAPKDEVTRNAILLSRAGYIHKEMAGVYSLLPLGLRVIKKIENIIRQEIDAIGGEEMKTSILQSREVWEKTDRWNDEIVDSWFKTRLKNGTEVGLSFTNEEAYANIMKQYVSSYKDLPVYPYDFKEIFRNEIRSKSGILRGREFYWKALYSFSKNEKDHEKFYEKAKEAYLNVFNRVGIGDLTYLTFASGGSFSKYSHEFQTITEAGEDTIFLSKEKNLAVNKEVYSEEVLQDLNLKKNDLAEKKAIEVGNIFTLGTRFSEPLELFYKDEKGEKKPVFMGSYGIGLGRLMGTVVEALSDENGLIWPKEISPFDIHLVLVGKDKSSKELADEIYKTLIAKGIETLYDERDLRAGEKFADADLLGISTRVVIGDRSSASGMLEVKDKATGETKEITLDHFITEQEKFKK